MNTRGQMVGGTFAALGGTAGSMQMLQKDANAAIMSWNSDHDVSGLRSLTATLHAYGNLTDDEYAQIIQVLDGDN
jgi:hypothetical protein